MTPPDSRTVRVGEHVSRLAAQHGFRSFGPLWDDPGNLELRRKRVTPHILAEGDTVKIPPLNVREVDRPTDQRHRFRAQMHSLVARLEFKTWDNKPEKEAPKEVLVDGKPTPFKAEKPGVIEVPVTGTTDRCTVRFAATAPVSRLGFLQSVATLAGVRERLNNLGYLAGDTEDPANLRFRSAVEEYQCDHGLVVDGKLGPKTRSSLSKTHGC